MARTTKTKGHHLLRQIAGWLLLGMGLLTVGYGAWAYQQARVYLDEVEASGQPLETFDVVNYLMTGSGLYVLIGCVLAALGGLYLALRQGAEEKDETLDGPHEPGVETPAKRPRPSQSGAHSSSNADDDELDELLRRVDDKQ